MSEQEDRLFSAKEMGLAADGVSFLDCSLGARYLLRVLLDRFNVRTGECRPTEEQLAACLNVTPRTVRRLKKELKKAGIIWFIQRKRSFACDYQIEIDPLIELGLNAKSIIRMRIDASKKDSDKKIQTRDEDILPQTNIEQSLSKVRKDGDVNQREIYIEKRRAFEKRKADEKRKAAGH